MAGGATKPTLLAAGRECSFWIYLGSGSLLVKMVRTKQAGSIPTKGRGTLLVLCFRVVRPVTPSCVYTQTRMVPQADVNRMATALVSFVAFSAPFRWPFVSPLIIPSVAMLFRTPPDLVLTISKGMGRQVSNCGPHSKRQPRPPRGRA